MSKDKNSKDKSNKDKSNKETGSEWRTIFILMSCLVVICVFVRLAASFISEENQNYSGKTGTEVSADQDIPSWIVQDFLPVNEYSRPGISLNEVNGIVVHYVANAGSTGWDNRSYFEGLAQTHATKAGAHFIIGLDGTIIQCVPLNELTYCSNSRNVDTISIECCHPEEDGKFTEETYQSLIKLCRWLMDRYDLETEDVIRHYDVTGKKCPLYFVEHEDEWEAFKEELK